GDPIGFASLYRRHVRSVYHYIASRVGTRQEAEDVTSEAFQRAWSSRETYRCNRPFRAWLFGVVRHALADHYRHRPARATVDLTTGGHTDGRRPELRLDRRPAGAAGAMCGCAGFAEPRPAGGPVLAFRRRWCVRRPRDSPGVRNSSMSSVSDSRRLWQPTYS